MSPGNGAAASLDDRCHSVESTAIAPSRSDLRALWVPMFLFVAISVADTVSSVLMLHKGLMDEYNPLMRYVWEVGGAVGFVAVKTVLVVVPLSIFNWLKTRRYWLVRRVMWLTIFGYCVIYALLFCIANY